MAGAPALLSADVVLPALGARSQTTPLSRSPQRCCRTQGPRAARRRRAVCGGPGSLAHRAGAVASATSSGASRPPDRSATGRTPATWPPRSASSSAPVPVEGSARQHAHVGPVAVQARAERDRRTQLRHDGTAALLDRRDGDAPPALHATALAEGRPGTSVRDVSIGWTAVDAQHHRVADDIVDPVALEHGLRQGDPHHGTRRRRRRPGPPSHRHAMARDVASRGPRTRGRGR